MNQPSNSAIIWNQWLKPALGGSAAFLLAGTVLLGGCGQKPQPASLAAGAKDGLPHNLAELNGWYIEPPVGQNAAAFFSQGFDALRLGAAGSSTLPFLGKGPPPTPGTPLPAPTKSALGAIVLSNQAALQLFAQGADCEQSRYSLDLTRGFEAVFPHLPKIRTAVQVVAVSALVHADARDGKQAATDVLTALGLARSLQAEPSLISQSMRAVSVSIAVAALEQTVNRSSVTQGSLSKLFSVLQRMEAYDARGEGFNRALAAERITVSAMLETPQKMLELLPAPGKDLSNEERSQIVARLQDARNLKAEQQYGEETFRQLMTIRQTDLPERLKAGDFIQQQAARATEKKLALVAWLIRGLGGPLARETGCLATLRLGLTAVALEQFRAAHSRYPDTLSELSPEYSSSALVDPFDGQPLRYKKKAGGYLLYSIGPDLKDNSGERMKEGQGDLAFAVVAPQNQEPGLAGPVTRR